MRNAALKKQFFCQNLILLLYPLLLTFKVVGNLKLYSLFGYIIVKKVFFQYKWGGGGVMLELGTVSYFLLISIIPHNMLYFTNVNLEE